MSFFKKPFAAVFNFFTPAKDTSIPPNGSRLRSKRGLKRAASEAMDAEKNHNENKRQRLEKTQRHSIEQDRASPTGGILEDTNTASINALRPDTDRMLMPPPSVVHLGHRKRTSVHKAPRLSLDLADSASQATRSSRAAKSELLDEYDMEEARRKAAATQLPPNSGIWEPGERELFFHLSYRGFEPLLPKNWMIDFPTLPLPVFAHEESDTPLITCHRSTQFRGIRALRELIDTGTLIRDRTVSSQDLRTEPILERAVNKYIAWALRDLGFPDKPSKTELPVHTIAILQSGQSTHDVIRSLAAEMHILAAKHRGVVNVQESIEQTATERLTPPSSQVGPTLIHPERSDGERTLPVIYGVMIASSILAIFTLNSHTPFPPFLVRTLFRNKRETFTPEKAAAINPHLPAQLEEVSLRNSVAMNVARNDEDSGIRYIANFDFSNASADVWNALVIAILAMQIRKTMGEVFDTWQDMKESQRDHGSTLHQDSISETTTEDRVGASIALPNIEDSWISNIDGDWSALAPSSPVSGLVDELLSSPSRPQRVNEMRRKGKTKLPRRNSDDPDA